MTKQEMFERDIHAMMQATISLRNWSGSLQERHRPRFDQAVSAIMMLVNLVADMQNDSIFVSFLDGAKERGDRGSR